MKDSSAGEALARGEAALSEGDFAAADGALRDALGLAEDPLQRADVLDASVRLALDIGEDLAARAWLRECEALRQEHAGPMSPELGRCWALRARLRTLAEGDHRGSAEAWERAVRLLSGAERSSAMLGLGLARLEQGHLEAAEGALQAARQDATEPALAEIEQSLARLFMAQGQHQRALSHVHARVGLVHRLHGPDSQPAADTLILLAAVAEADQDLESAVSAMDRAVGVLGRVLGADDTETTMAAAYLLALRSRLGGAPKLPE